MKVMRLRGWGEEFTLNNNNDKLDRTEKEDGPKASPEEFLGVYDRLAGHILDKDGKKIPNGILWERYKKLKEEQPKYLRTLEERERTLNEGEKRQAELIQKHLDHKRAFLGTLMTIAAAVVAGLFILTSGDQASVCINKFATIGGLGFALFIIGSSFYLTFILSQESIVLSAGFEFVQKSKKEFIEKIGIEIVDLDTYERYRKEKYQEEQKSKFKRYLLWEGWFVIVNTLFILSAIITLLMFLSSLSDFCLLNFIK